MLKIDISSFSLLKLSLISSFITLIACATSSIVVSDALPWSTSIIFTFFASKGLEHELVLELDRSLRFDLPIYISPTGGASRKKSALNYSYSLQLLIACWSFTGIRLYESDLESRYICFSFSQHVRPPCWPTQAPIFAFLLRMPFAQVTHSLSRYPCISVKKVFKNFCLKKVGGCGD